MENCSGIKFGDLQKDERYKRLERNLKLSLLRKSGNIKAGDENGYFSSPRCPSLSTIDPDSSYTNIGTPNSNLHISKVGSEIVSSSTNLRNIFTMHRPNYKPLATSSVKNFPTRNVDKDRAMMPPPSISSLNNNRKQNHFTSQYDSPDTQKILQKLDNEPNTPSPSVSSSTLAHHESNSMSVSDSQDSPTTKVFSRWRVILNDQGQLIVKGTLDGIRICRSKPVKTRLAHNKVQSIYSHTYILDGNICDDRRELPEYVYGKFFNGFPDDWENVHQLWRNFISEGCKQTFRWPTPITDDDDDLQSEVTDYVYPKKKVLDAMKSSNISNSHNGSSLGYYSKSHSDSNQNLENSEQDKKSDAKSAIQIPNKKVENPEGVPKVKVNNACDCNNENNTKTSNTSANSSNTSIPSSNFLFEIFKEDKLRILLSKLGHKNCPAENLNKFFELNDFLRHMMSLKLTDDSETNDKKLNSSECGSQVCQKCNSTKHSETFESHPEEKLKDTEIKNVCSTGTNTDLPQQVKEEKFLKPSDSEVDKTVESSDSDTCMGIPHAQLDYLLKPRPPKDQRYKERRNSHSKDRKGADNNLRMERQGSSVKVQTPKQYDSSVSITEDEYDRRHPMRPGIIQKEIVKETAQMNSNEQHRPRDRLKPTIKSNEEVYVDLKQKYLSNQKLLKSQILMNEKEVEEKLNYDDYIDNDNDGQDKISKVLLEHPFLSYDSEDYPDGHDDTTVNQVLLENQLRYKRNQQELKVSKAQKAMSRNEPFGTKENPYLLVLWIPCVMYTDESHRDCCLTFEGKLLNQVGHIEDRKFVTDIIYKRHSSKLVETVKREFFFLEGDLKDSKHAVPKQLLKLCLSGCPSKIDEFCEEWKDLKLGVLPQVATSNDAIKRSKIGKSNSESAKKVANSDVQHQKSDRKRVAQTLKYSSNSDDSEDESKKKTTHRKSKSTRKPTDHVTHDCKPTSKSKDNMPSEPMNTKLRKRQRVDMHQVPEQNAAYNYNMRSRPPVQYTTPKVLWSYEKEQQYFDVLSEDQISEFK